MSMMIAPDRFGASANVEQQEFTVTIASGTVSSSLTNFPVMVRLSDMPSEFWSNVKRDGGDIRATTTGGTAIPHDLSRFDYTDQDGVLWVRITVNSGSATSFKITCGDPNLSKLAVTDSNGTKAVWADYKVVCLMGESAMNRVTWTPLRVLGDPDFFDEIATHGPIGAHDGITTDGTYRYIFHSNQIKKYDLSWNLIATNSDPAGDSGLALVNDLGDGCYHNGKLYVSLGDNPGGTVQYLAVYSAADLSFIEAFNITTDGLSASGFAYNADDGLLYSINWNDGTEITKFDPSDGSFQGSITVSGATLTPAQGIEIWKGAFWVPLDTVEETYRVEFDGTVTSSGLYGTRDAATTIFWVGLCAEGDTLLQADDAGSGDNEYIRTYKPFDIAKGGGGGVEFYADARLVADLASTGALGTTFTLGCTYSPSDNTQRTLMALCETGTGFAANVHVDVDDGNKIGMWDSSNSWQYTSPNVDPALDTCHRVNVVYNGTTARSIYHNGGSKGTDTTTTTRGSGVSHVVLGAAREGDFTSSWRGQLGFAYARSGVLSDAWIAAEYLNLNAPASFYSVA